MRAALLYLALAAPVLAQPASDEELLKSLGSRRASLNFAATPLSEVAGFVSDISGVNVGLLPGVDGDAPVTLKVQGLGLDDALRLALEAAGEGLELRAWCGAVWIAPKGVELPAVPAPAEGSPLARPLAVNFSDTPATAVASFLGDLTGLEVRLAKGEQERLEATQVDLKLRSTTLGHLLAILRVVAGVEGKVEGEALAFSLVPIVWDGAEVESIEVSEEPGRHEKPRTRTITDRAALQELVRCLAPSDVTPTGGENKWRLRLAGKDGKTREVWVFDRGEWGQDGKSRGLSRELPRLLERLLE